jgi:hypothetical protein
VEDRGVIEFRLTGLPQFIFNATLVLPVYASNGPFPFTVDVLSDTGDGVLNRSDWAKGSRFASFSYSGEQVVTLDVTSIIASALAAGDPFVEFNFRVPVPSDIELNGPFVAFGALALPPAAFLMINEPSRLVSIDIKPGSDTNPINPGSHGEVSVAILGTSDFDATTVNSATVRFGATGTESAPLLVTVEDVNDDARADLLLHFNTQETGIRCRDVSASLTGETFDGQSIQGSDSVRTVGCK